MGLGINHLSLQYYGVPVKAVTLAGVPYNPTVYTVQMAFMPQATQSPGSSDWQAATWATVPNNILYPYAAYCLIGPGGTITLNTGTYVVYLKIIGSPEIPVQYVDYLEIS